MNIFQKIYWKFFTCRKILKMRQQCSGRQQMSGAELLELSRVFKLSSAAQAVEIGCFCGITSRILGWLFSQYNPDGTLYCIDIFEAENSQGDYYKDRYKKENMSFNYEECFDRNIAPYISNIHKLKGFSESVELPEGISFDFIFIDGDHSYEAVKKDIDRYLPLLKKGGYVCFHDVTIGRSGTIKALLDTIWPYPNSDYYRLVSHVDSLLAVQKIMDTPPKGYSSAS